MGQEDMNKVGQDTKPTATKAILSVEVATDHVNAFLDYYDVDIDDIADDDQREALQNCIPRLIKATKNGWLAFNMDDMSIRHCRKSGDDVIYREFTGEATLSMGKRKETDYFGRIYELFGSLSGLGHNTICKYKKRDIAIIRDLAAVFLV